VALGTVCRQARIDVSGTRRDVIAGQVVEFGRATRREGDVHHPRGPGRVDGRGGARDVVAGEPGQRGFVTRLRTVRDLGVRHPLRVDELRHRAERLLGLLGVDAGQIDGDAVVVRARAADLRLAHVQRVDAFVDDGDGPLLHFGAALACREVRQLIVDVGATRQVETTVEVV